MEAEAAQARRQQSTPPGPVARRAAHHQAECLGGVGFRKEAGLVAFVIGHGENSLWSMSLGAYPAVRRLSCRSIRDIHDSHRFTAEINLDSVTGTNCDF